VRALVVIVIGAIALLAALGANVSTAAMYAQVATGIVAVLLGLRALGREDARLELVAADVRSEYGPDAENEIGAWLNIAVFNPASRGNVVRLAYVYAATRDAPFLMREVEPRAESYAPVPTHMATLVRTVVDMAAGKWLVAHGAIDPPTEWPLTLGPYETKVIRLFVAYRWQRDAVIRRGYIVDVFDGRNRRSTRRTYAFMWRVRWWTHLVPERVMNAWVNRAGRRG